jgi:hypothetical protein
MPSIMHKIHSSPQQPEKMLRYSRRVHLVSTLLKPTGYPSVRPISSSFFLEVRLPYQRFPHHQNKFDPRARPTTPHVIRSDICEDNNEEQGPIRCCIRVWRRPGGGGIWGPLVRDIRVKLPHPEALCSPIANLQTMYPAQDYVHQKDRLELELLDEINTQDPSLFRT